MQGIGYHWEMWALASGGWKPLEVLRAATLHGAEAIGYAQDLGSLETGKLADLVVLSKDPLEDIHNTNSIRYVMKNGELFEGDTLDRIWPDRRPLAAALVVGAGTFAIIRGQSPEELARLAPRTWYPWQSPAFSGIGVFWYCSSRCQNPAKDGEKNVRTSPDPVGIAQVGADRGRPSVCDPHVPAGTRGDRAHRCLVAMQGTQT